MKVFVQRVLLFILKIYFGIQKLMFYQKVQEIRTGFVIKKGWIVQNLNCVLICWLWKPILMKLWRQYRLLIKNTKRVKKNMMQHRQLLKNVFLEIEENWT
eukprot:UN04176